jgi:hypothetical protein
VGDQVFLHVSLMKRVLRPDKKGKPSLRFIGPHEILDRVGPVAYRLALPPNLSGVHPVFYISMDTLLLVMKMFNWMRICHTPNTR